MGLSIHQLSGTGQVKFFEVEIQLMVRGLRFWRSWGTNSPSGFSHYAQWLSGLSWCPRKVAMVRIIIQASRITLTCSGSLSDSLHVTDVNVIGTIMARVSNCWLHSATGQHQIPILLPVHIFAALCLDSGLCNHTPSNPWEDNRNIVEDLAIRSPQPFTEQRSSAWDTEFRDFRDFERNESDDPTCSQYHRRCAYDIFCIFPEMQRKFLHCTHLIRCTRFWHKPVVIYFTRKQLGHFCTHRALGGKKIQNFALQPAHRGRVWIDASDGRGWSWFDY